MPLFTIEAEKFSHNTQQAAIEALENGKIIYLPKLNFQLAAEELAVLKPDAVAEKVKNISFDPNSGKVRGLQPEFIAKSALYATCMQRYYQYATQLLADLLPRYTPALQTGRTSLRPVEIEGRRPPSIRKDDTLLHVDAFPANPNQGRRILRVFTNINPDHKPRLWNIGEEFSEVVARFGTEIKGPLPGSAALLKMLGITKGWRSTYDHLMLEIHDRMKADRNYQQTVAKTQIAFPAGTTWIVQTDQVSHAVLSGQHVFEQTFYLPVAAMQKPELSPFAVLKTHCCFA